MKKLSLVLGLVCFVVGFALAQRTVSGTVVDATGEPLIGASILVKGTTTGAVTDIDGSFSLNVPEDRDILVVSYTGYETQELPIGDATTLEITLSEGVSLDEVVVTGLGISKEKKTLGYGVTTLASDAVERRVESDVARILRGKAPGVDITTTSGLAGSGTNVIIRGYSSISGNNQPLFVVDGIPFNTDTNNDRNFVTGGATASSRFLDIDPNNIAEISILKGLSATVLYGEAGRNGVVLITTKTGNAGGNTAKKQEITVSQQVSFTEVANLPDYQNSYGNGFSGDYGLFFSNWGPAFDVRGSNGIAEDGTVPHPYDNSRYNADFPEFIGERYDYKPYDNITEFFETGLVTSTSVGIDRQLGAAGAISANYSYQNDDGFVPANTYERHNASIGGNFQLENGIRINGTLTAVNSDRIAPPASVGFGSNPSGASVFGNVLYTPRSIDLFGLPFQSPIDGRSIYYRSGNDIQNPRWGLANTFDEEKVRRYFGNMNVSYDFNDWLSVLYRISFDQYTQRNRRAVNKGGAQVFDGQLQTFERLNLITDHVLNLSASRNLGDDFSFDFLLGTNFRRERQDRTSVFSDQQFVFGLFTHDNFINHNNFSSIREENTIGVYSTATLGFRNFLYLGLQARNDWTSTLEPENNSILYPSASLSFVPTDAFPALQNSRTINYLKFRAGYGTSAGYPDPYQTRTFLQTATRVGMTPGGAILNTNSNLSGGGTARLGNPNLQPELLTELEFGLEARFLNNRIGVDLSYYDKQSDDLIVDLRLDPATGFNQTTINAAEIYNRGIELGLTFTPFRGDFYWDINVNYTRNRNFVESVAEGVDQVPIAGYTNLGNFAIPGEQYGTILGSAFQRANGELQVGTSNGEYLVNADLQPIGNPNPNYQANLINTFSYKNLSFSFQWSYIDGGDIYSITTATMLARGLTTDTDFNRFLPLILPGVKEDADGNIVPNDIQGYAGDYFFAAYFGADEGSIFDGTVIRLREVALSYDLPKKWLDNTPFGSISLRAVGENLFFNAPNFPEGVNFDPEVLSLGVGNGRGFDLLTGPTAKKYGVNLFVTF
jgi:TonB-linked SusC/RagA family outer membrane protein